MTETPSSLEAASPDPSLEKQISRHMIRLQKEFFGRGPEQARTYIVDDLVSVVLEGGFTALEKTLLAEGRSDIVMRQRATFQAVMRERFIAMITETMHRQVRAYASANHHDPDLSIESFLLEPVETR